MDAKISAAIASARTASEIAKSTNKLANHNELVGAVSEVSVKLMKATAVALARQEKQSAMRNRISELEREVARLGEAAKKMDVINSTGFLLGLSLIN